jgi:hypothetical protein
MQDHQKMITLLPGLKQKQVEFISISSDESYTKWIGYLAENKFNWQHYKTGMPGKNIIRQPGIETYPTYILLVYCWIKKERSCI